MKIKKTITYNDSNIKNEFPMSHYIPYKCHWDANTILTKNNELLQIIKVGGYSFETADDDDLAIKKNLRNSLFKNLSTGNILLYFHTVRKKKEAVKPKYDPKNSDEKIINDFSIYLNDEWDEKLRKTKSYFNELYISVLYRPEKGGVALVENIYKKLRQKSDKSYWGKDMKEMKESLDEITTRIINTFKDYDPYLLGAEQTNGNYYCEMLEFLNTIVNVNFSGKVLLPKTSIDKYLPQNRILFSYKNIEIISPKQTKYAGIISVKEYAPFSYEGVLDGMLQMPFEFIITQSFSFANRTVAIGKMQLQQNRMIQSEDKAVSQIQEISEALDMAMSGDIGFGEHHLTILCIDTDQKSLENTLSMASVELSNCGMQPVRERINLEPCFWGQLPGNIEYLIRRSTVNTLNLAGFASLHNYALGKRFGNHWGEYVTILNTTSGTPYYFNFHLRDVGHTLIIGPTGGGKTVLMNFLCAQAQKFKPRMFFFDKDRGAEIFIRAVKGSYIIVDPGKKCNFNPFQLPDNGENRAFLLDLLKLLVSTNGEKITAEDIKVLNSAIDGNYRLNFKDRKLSNIVPFLGINTTGSLASRIEMWHGGGSHAKIFDNDSDSVDLTKSRVFGFEMAELLKDKASLGPVLLYIFHRINSSLDGYPTMIVLDEAWALIDNPVFGPRIKDWLKVLRKLNTFVIFATQSVEDASKSAISDTLIQQTATQIFLPNLKATSVYRTAFMLSEREFNIIKTTDPSSRYFLVKQGVSATVARIDLSGMDNIINVLSGRIDTVILLDEIRAKYGNNPEKWLPVFYEKVKEIQK